MLFERADAIHQYMQRKLREEPAIKADKMKNLINNAVTQ